MNSVLLPPSVVLELTYQCNHRCLFCSCPWDAPNAKYPKGNELCLEEWKDAINKLYNNGVQFFSISGGESTLKKCMPDVVKYIHEEGKKRGYDNKIVLISNGLTMTEDYLQLFQTLQCAS